MPSVIVSEGTPLLLKPNGKITYQQHSSSGGHETITDYLFDTGKKKITTMADTPNKKSCEGDVVLVHEDSDREKNPSKDSEKTFGLKFFASLPRRRKYVLIFTTLATFWSGAAFSVLGPFCPTEAVRRGMDISTVGIVFGLFQVLIFLTAPVFGNYLIKLGPRFVFLSGIFLGGPCNVLFGTLQHCPSGRPFVTMSIIIRSVEAVGFSAFLTSSYAIMSCEFKENVAFTFGIIQTSSGLGFMLGPTIGGALYELGGFGLPFYFAGVSVLLNGLAVFGFLPPMEEVRAKRKGSMLSLLRSPMVAIPVCSVFVGVGSMAVYDSTFAQRLVPLDMSVGMVETLSGSMSGIFTVMSSVWGYISDTKDSQAPLIVVGHLVFAAGFLLIGNSVLLPFVPFNIWTVLIGLVCIGVSFGCALIPTMKCMVIGATELGYENNMDTNALVSGLFNSVHTLGWFVAPVGIGFVIRDYDYPTAYTVVGTCSIFMVIVSFVFFAYRNIKNAERKEKRGSGSYNYKDVRGVESGVTLSHFVSDNNYPSRIVATFGRRQSA